MTLVIGTIIPSAALSLDEVLVRRRLLLQDLSDFLQPISPEEAPLIHAAPEAHDLLQWRALICGPVHSAWQHVTLQLRVCFPPDYPSSPPRITFDTPVFHPNVSLKDGSICASVLTPGGWSPAYRLHALLVALQSLLDEPNAESPLNAHAAELFLREAPQHQPNEKPLLCYWRQVYRVHEQNMEQWVPKRGSSSACTDDAVMELTPSSRMQLAPLLVPATAATPLADRVSPRLHREEMSQPHRFTDTGAFRQTADNALTTVAGPASPGSPAHNSIGVNAGEAVPAAAAASTPVGAGDDGDDDSGATGDSPLSQCARQFVAAAPRGTLGQPYKLHPDQRAALLRAVEARVVRESAHLSASTAAAVAAPLRLSSRDRAQVEAVIQLLLAQPGYFVQLHGVLPRPKGRKAAAQQSIMSQLESPLHELQALYEFLRATGLAQGIGTASAIPDDRHAVRDSLRVGSLMEEAAFWRLLQHRVQHAPAPLPIVHMPPLLLSAWAREAAVDATALMLSWCQERRDALLAAKYVVFHWSDGHYCSLVLNVDVWRRGPEAAAGADAHGHTANPGPAAAVHSSSSSSPTPPSAVRARKKRKTIAVISSDLLYSESDDPLPILHLDTLAGACGFQDASEGAPASSMLARICSVWNRLCDTAWPESPSTAVQHLRHLCGPAQQPDDDDWSCGYRLLEAWNRLYADMATRSGTAAGAEAAPSLTPHRFNQACTPLSADSVCIERLVQDLRAQFAAAAPSAQVCTYFPHTVTLTSMRTLVIGNVARVLMAANIVLLFLASCSVGCRPY